MILNKYFQAIFYFLIDSKNPILLICLETLYFL